MSKAKTWLTKDEFFADFDADPDLRAAWERTAFARAVGDAVIRHRTALKLSQRALATQLGMKPSAVARLELGEHNPSIEMLQRLSDTLGMRFVVDVAPVGTERAPLPSGVSVVQDLVTPGGSRVLVAAG